MIPAELINGDSLYRRLHQSGGASSPARLKQNYLAAHHYPVIGFCQCYPEFNKNLSTFFRTSQIQQQYTLVNGEQWFPSELKAELNMGMFGVGKIRLSGIGSSIIANVNLNPEFKRKDFGVAILDVESDAKEKPEKFWQLYRPNGLDKKEFKTYHVLDSLGRVMHFDRLASSMQTLATGQFPMHYFNLNINKLIKYNGYEGFRPGLGIISNNDISERFNIGGYFAYGTKDEKYKYGGNLQLIIDKESDFRFNLSYIDDVTESGSFSFFKIVQNFNYDFYRDFLLKKFDKTRCISGGFQFRTMNYCVLDISAESSENMPLYKYRYGATYENAKIFTSSFGLAVINASLRYAYGEKFIKGNNFTYSAGTKAPVFWFKYSRGIAGLWNGEYNFSRFMFRVEKSFYIKYFGKPSFRLDAGYVKGDVPLTVMYFTKGSFRNFNIDVPNTFATVRVNEFASNKFVAIYLKHDFGKLLFGRRKFSPSPVLLTSIGWGDLVNKEKHYDVNFKTMDKGYFESGFMINSLMKTGIYDLGIGAYYRYGPYGFEQFKDNISIRLNITFPFLQ